METLFGLWQDDSSRQTQENKLWAVEKKKVIWARDQVTSRWRELRGVNPRNIFHSCVDLCPFQFQKIPVAPQLLNTAQDWRQKQFLNGRQLLCVWQRLWSSGNASSRVHIFIWNISTGKYTTSSVCVSIWAVCHVRWLLSCLYFLIQFKEGEQTGKKGRRK